MGQGSNSLDAPGEEHVVGAGRLAAGSRPEGAEEESLSFQDVDLSVAQAGGLLAAPGVDEVLGSRERVFRIHHADLSCEEVPLRLRAVSWPQVYLDLRLCQCETAIYSPPF